MLTQFEKIMLLPREDSGTNLLIARVHSSHLSFFGRRTPIIIQDSSGKKIIRYAYGSGALKGVGKDVIALDYDGLVSFNLKMKKMHQHPVTVRKAMWYETYLIFSKHPDLAVQLSLKLGMASLFLGVTGLFLGIVSLF